MKRVTSFLLLLLFLWAGSSWGQTTVTIGTGTDITSSTTSTVSPYKTYWMDGQDQFLFTAAELTAAGVSSGNITKLAFNVGGTVATATLNEFTISMQQTAATTLTAFLTSGWTQCYIGNVVAVAGWNTYTFTTPFFWDGVSSVVFKTCFNNSAYTSTSHVYYTATSPSTGVHYYEYGDYSTSSGCAVTNVDGNTWRPNVQITWAPATSPILTTNPASLAFPYTASGSTSVLSYVLAGTNLTAGPIVVTAPAGFKVSTDGTTYTPSVNVTYTAPTLANTTIYVRFEPTGAPAAYTGNVTNVGGGANANVAVSGSSDVFTLYCASGATSTSDEEIYSVTVNGVTNALDCATTAPGPGSILNRYSNFFPLGPIFTLNQGAAVPFTVEENECDGATYYSFGTSIWIDFNQDGDFADAGEQAFVESATLIGPRNVTGLINVPPDALLGTTAMRVTVAEGLAGASLTPCLSYGYGETEDYQVTINLGVFGALDGYVYKFGTTDPIAGATVSFSAYSTTTNASGYYSLPSVAAGTYNVTASATGYASQTVTGVVVNGGATTSQNFGLTWAQIGVSPSSFTENMVPNELRTKTLTISNTGTGPLNYNIAFAEGTDNSANLQAPQEVYHDKNYQTETRPDASVSGINKPNNTDVYTTCPTGSLFSLEPNIASWGVATSEAEPGYRVYQYYSGVSGPIGGITFWGGNMVYTSGWASCATEDPMAFNIKFYTDNAGTPGTEMASFSASLTRVSTEVALGTYGFLYQYQYTFPSNVNLGNGWVSIEGQTASPNCWFMWSATSTAGATFYKQWDNATSTYTTGTYGCAMCLAAGSTWLGLNPGGSGTVPAGGSVDITVSFNATGLENITKTGTINITSNSQNARTTTTVPVTMIVGAAQQPPAPPTTPVPANGATLVALQPTLSWTNGERTSEVMVAISRIEEEETVVVYTSPWFVGNSVNLATAGILLEPKFAHTWRVTARNTAGSTPGATWNFTTIGEGGISGIVRDAYTLAPISGATVTASGIATPKTTGADGLYHFTKVLEGNYTVTASKIGYNVEPPVNVTVVHNGTATANFDMDVILDPPRNLAAAIQNNYDVHLTWQVPGQFDPTWITYSGETITNSIGTGGAANFDVAARWLPATLANYPGGSVTKIKFVPGEAGTVCTYTLKVWTTTGYPTTQPTLIYSQVLSTITADVWNEVTLTTPVPIDPAKELWIGFNCNTTAGYPAGCDAGPQVEGYGNMMYWNNAWSTLYIIAPTLTFNWAVKGYIETAKGPSTLLPVEMTNSNYSSKGTLASRPEPISPAAVSNDGVKAPAALTGYNVYRDNVKIANNIAPTSYDDLGLTPATYAYEVSAQYNQGESAKIGPVNVTILLGGYASGVVTDATTLAPVAGATVSTTGYSTTTLANGTYNLALPVGTWDITAAATGYTALTTTGVVINANLTTTQDFALTIAPPVLTSVAQYGMALGAIWTGNPLFEPAAKKASDALLTSNTQPMTRKASSGKPAYKNPGTRLTGDLIADPFIVPSIPYTTSGTTVGYNDDYDAICPYDSPGGPDVVYRISNPTEIHVDISLCNSLYDTKLYVLAADGVTIIDCNDDACGDDGWKSALSNVILTAGSTYYIIVDGYDDASYGTYELVITEYVPCNIDCSPGAIAEGEVCATDGYVDNFNAGCNAVPPAFGSTINSGDIICGTASTYLLDGANRRDTDWYKFINTTPKQVTFTGKAEFPLQILLVGDDGDCATYVPAAATALACEEATFTYNCPPGTWYFWVGPSGYTGVPCATVGNQYEVHLTTVDIFMPFYHVYRTDNKALVATTYNSFYLDENVTLGSNYCYQVSEVVTEGGRETGLSNSLCATVVCPAPTALGATIGTTTANLSWTPGAVETVWNIEWGLSTFVQGSGTMVTGVTSNPYTISGLIAGVSYKFYVQADCGGGYASTWAGPYTFTMPCAAATIPYTQNFDGVTAPAIPACMTVTNDNADTHLWATGTTYYTSAPNSMYITYNSALAMDDWFFTPPLALSAGKTYVVTFQYRAHSSSFPEKLAVKWGTAPNAAGMTLGTIFDNANIANTTFATGTGTFTTTASGEFYVGWHGYSDLDEWNLYVDDISIMQQATCIPPTALTATGITQNSANLGWTPGGTETLWNIAWGLSGITPATGTIVYGVSNPYPLGGLSASTAYTFYVQGDCGGGDLSTWAGPFNFTTTCSSFGVPFAEGFEGAVFPPTCWTNTSWEQSLYGAPHSGLEWAYSNLLGSQLITPEIVVPATGAYQFSFWYRAESASYPQAFDVLISNNNGASWTMLQSFTGIINTVYTQIAYSLTAYAGQSVWVKFVGQYGTGGLAYGICVDDVLIDLIPPPQQTVTLPLGWSGWSSYIAPAAKATFAGVVAPITADMAITQYFSNVYWPEYGINTMGDFSNAHGYVTKMNAQSALTLVGNVVASNITLNEGWNIIPVISTCNVAASELENIAGFIIAVEIAGNGVYYPAEEIYTLTQLVPGKAYYVKTSTAGMFTFPACGADGGYTNIKPVRNQNITNWNDVNYTGVSHTVVFDQNATSQLAQGDVIGAFTSNGLCAGMVMVDANTTALSLFANDISTTQVDGFADGELISFRVYRQSTGEEFTLDVTYNAQMPNSNGLYAVNGLSVVNNLTMSITGINGQSLSGLSIYPNPSNGVFTISLNGMDKNIDYVIMNAQGQQVVEGKLLNTQQIDLTAQPKGVYFIKFTSNSVLRIEKIVVK